MKGASTTAVTTTVCGVGQNNPACLCREPRLQGDAYFDFMDEVVDAIQVCNLSPLSSLLGALRLPAILQLIFFLTRMLLRSLC